MSCMNIKHAGNRKKFKYKSENEEYRKFHVTVNSILDILIKLEIL